MGLCDPVIPYEYQNTALDMSVTYGYSPRYAELKSARDYYEGGFCGTYSTWVTGYDQSFLVAWRIEIVALLVFLIMIVLMICLSAEHLCSILSL